MVRNDHGREELLFVSSLCCQQLEIEEEHSFFEELRHSLSFFGSCFEQVCQVITDVSCMWGWCAIEINSVVIWSSQEAQGPLRRVHLANYIKPFMINGTRSHLGI
jgi:hypothetical protein